MQYILMLILLKRSNLFMQAIASSLIYIKEIPLYTYIKNEIKEDIIDGIKNKMAMKAIEKISSSCKKDGDIKWNFTKFIVDREGNVVARYSPTFKPEDMEEKIKKLI